MHTRTWGLAFAALAGCSDPKPAPPAAPVQAAAPAAPVGNTPDWKKAIRHEVRFDPARRAVVVSVELEPGYHAYTVGETIGRPLALTFDPDSAWVAEGEIELPPGRAKDLPIGRSVIVEGRAEVVARVKRTAPGGTAKGKFFYQVCTDQACDRPRSAPFSLTVPE